MKLRLGLVSSAIAACTLMLAAPAQAQIYDVTIDGGDAIWLAGRTDLVVPPASDPWPGGLARHDGPTPEEIQETMPSFISVVEGDVIKALDPAIGGISFFNGFGGTVYGPGGNGSAGSSLTSFGGISSYVGPEGPLVGVFLSDDVPASGAPAGLDFSSGGMGTDFLSITPLLGQVFYIGDGRTSGGDFQSFVAPTGATRLFLGIPDGFGFDGPPGAYDDNDGSYRVRIGLNQVPVIPEPETYALMLAGLALLRVVARRRHT
jgi:hypothetical protein